jgi:hypothetical protein
VLEAFWKANVGLGDVLIAQNRFEEAEVQLEAARFGFEALLRRHLRAFADQAAKLYAGSGNECRRALELARASVENRPNAVRSGERVRSRRMPVRPQPQATAARIGAGTDEANTPNQR